MAIKRLVLSDFRNIARSDIELSPSLNFVSGDNGSGKTSLLEALSTVSLGRSFRTRKYKNLVRYDCKQSTLFAEVEVAGVTHQVGVNRSLQNGSTFKLNGSSIPGPIDLANLVPMQVINSESFNLLSGPPTDRRHFLDWLVFHVKHSFQSDWREYMRCLKQRNAVLRSDIVDTACLDAWDDRLCAVAEKVDDARKGVIEQFISVFNDYCVDFDFVNAGSFTISYRRGWSDGHTSFKSSLKANRIRDEKLGYTSVGPHKSDMVTRFNGKSIGDLFSRGQLKSLVSAMYAAQIHMFSQLNPSNCLLLVDDLPAELDTANLKLVSGWLCKLKNVQIIITGVDLKHLISLWPNHHVAVSKLFHVKHGEVTEQSPKTE